VDQSGRKHVQTGEHYITRSFITCTQEGWGREAIGACVAKCYGGETDHLQDVRIDGRMVVKRM
jgi:hypothetical protein